MYSESSLSLSYHSVKVVNVRVGCASNVNCDVVTYTDIRVALNLPNISPKALPFAVSLSFKE